MADSRDVFRCDYCGQLAHLDEGQIYYEAVDQLDDGRVIHVAAVYCSNYCGRTAVNRAGTARG
jgi:hypothetical protein